MAVRDLVLAHIIERRGYGYELADRLSEHFRTLDISQASIYMALQSLEKDELVAVAEYSGEPPHVRKIYEATARGRGHHQEWRRKAATKAPLREELHLQMMVAEVADIPALLRGLDQVEEECEEKLAQVMALSDETRRVASISEFGAALVRDGLAMHLQSTLEWVSRSRQALRNVSGTTSTGVPGRDRP